MRYNFHEQLAKVKKDPSYKLPEDINKPVIDFLIKIGCNIGAETVKSMQAHLNYGRIELRRTDVPDAVLSIQVDCGMADGWEDSAIGKDGKWSVTKYHTVKNANLDKKKLTLTKETK